MKYDFKYVRQWICCEVCLICESWRRRDSLLFMLNGGTGVVFIRWFSSPNNVNSSLVRFNKPLCHQLSHRAVNLFVFLVFVLFLWEKLLFFVLLFFFNSIEKLSSQCTVQISLPGLCRTPATWGLTFPFMTFRWRCYPTNPLCERTSVGTWWAEWSSVISLECFLVFLLLGSW